MRMQIDFRRPSDDVCVAVASGRLDLTAAGPFRARLADAVSRGCRRLVVDLTDVPFVDSSGLGALVGGLKAARQAGGDLRICGVGEQVSMVLELTSLDRVLRAFESVDDAIASF